MRITNIQIGNFLSFSKPQSLVVERFNLLIGPNNQGKSNVLKAVEFLSAISNAYSEDSLNEGVLDKEIHFSDLQSSLSFNIDEEDLFYGQSFDHKIEFTYGFSLTEKELVEALEGTSQYNKKDKQGKEVIDPLHFLFQFSPHNNIEITGNLRKHEGSLRLSITKILFPNSSDKRYNLLYDIEEGLALHYSTEEYFDGAYLDVNRVRYNKEDVENYISSELSHLIQKFFQNIRPIFNRELHLIDAVRNIQAFSHENDKSSENRFVKTVERLMYLRDGKFQERTRFQKIKKLIRQLIYPELAVEQIELSFPRHQNTGKYALRINIGDQTILPLSQLGSGVEQLIYLACEIMGSETGSVFLIEEPEVHLHPHLQRAFIRFLQEEISEQDYQFFITTHSSAFLDPFIEDEKSSVHQVRKIEGINTICNFKKDFDKSNLLFELGVKGSDLLQSNGIIWVEGPSDRLYILRWLSLFSESISMSKSVVKSPKHRSNFPHS